MSHFSSRSVQRHLTTATRYLISTPLLMVGVFVLAFVIQVSMLLTVGRAPAETFMPASPEPVIVAQTEMPECAMFCTEKPTGQVIAFAPDQTASFGASTSSGSSSSTCWLLCDGSSDTTGATDLLTEQRAPNRSI